MTTSTSDRKQNYNKKTTYIITLVDIKWFQLNPLPVFGTLNKNKLSKLNLNSTMYETNQFVKSSVTRIVKKIIINR